MGKERSIILPEAQDSCVAAAAGFLKGEHVPPGNPEKDVEETAA